MRPVLENTPVVAECPNHHKWDTEIIAGNTMPQTASCPECDLLVAFYPSLKAAWHETHRSLPSGAWQ